MVTALGLFVAAFLVFVFGLIVEEAHGRAGSQSPSSIRGFLRMVTRPWTAVQTISIFFAGLLSTPLLDEWIGRASFVVGIVVVMLFGHLTARLLLRLNQLVRLSS